MPETDGHAGNVDSRLTFFERREDDASFERSLMKLVGALQEQFRAMFMSGDNVLRMNHGETWVHSAREDEPDATMHIISAEGRIPLKDIADNDLSLIARTLQPLNEEMQRQFARNMYAAVGAAAESVGNVVDARGSGSFAQLMLEMFRKIEFGVDREGNISMPQIHLNSETYKRFSDKIQSIPPEIETEIEKIKTVKAEEALGKEADRKAKFKRENT